MARPRLPKPIAQSLARSRRILGQVSNQFTRATAKEGREGDEHEPPIMTNLHGTRLPNTYVDTRGARIGLVGRGADPSRLSCEVGRQLSERHIRELDILDPSSSTAFVRPN